MTSVFEVLGLQCGYGSARAALREIVESAMRSGSAIAMRLRANAGAAGVSKRVLITFGRDSDVTHFNETWSVCWTSENGGPFPEFNGRLSIQYAPGGGAQLEIFGEYAPPLGTLGKGFDLVLGQRIASASCKNLLFDLSDRIEHRFAV